jgi:hypothetical protein
MLNYGAAKHDEYFYPYPLKPINLPNSFAEVTTLIGEETRRENGGQDRKSEGDTPQAV